MYITFLIILLAACGSGTSQNSANPSNSEVNYIQNKGSDTIVNLALAWAEKYQNLHPEIQISVTGGGTGTGIAALFNRTTDIANASRAIKSEERAQAAENGIEPAEFIIARDAIAVIVNLENPIDQLTLQQVSDIYSGKINNWREVGGENRPIVRLSRETNSGTHLYFLENVLRMGQAGNKTFFSTDTLLLPSSEGITAEVRENPNAIGYDGLGYVTSDVKMIAIAKASGEAYIIPSAETVNDGSYPIARELYMYTPGQPMGAVAAYIEWIFTEDAQAIVKELGFVPVK